MTVYDTGMLRADPSDIGRIPEFQRNILSHLWARETPTSITELAAMEGVPRISVVTALIHLEADGKVRRLFCEMYELVERGEV